jgi:Flp pilus assembly protein TadG
VTGVRALLRSSRSKRGQTAVEFALVFPLVLVFIVGTISGAYLYFQNEAMTNGARAASRWATIEGSLNVTSTHCESGSPDSIVGQVQKNAKFLPVNPGKLCAKVISAGPPAVYSTTELVQVPYVASQANIVVDASPNLTNPECITVNITYTPPTLPGPFPTIVMQAHSSAPTLAATTSSTCPAPTKAS